MSVKNIKAALDQLGRTRVDDLGKVGRILTSARAEVEAIERAAVVVVRDSALDDWDTAMSTELADGIRAIQAIAKECK